MRVTSPYEFVRNVLSDGLWHTTPIERYETIQRDGLIKVEPTIPESDRHKTAGGPAHHPFVRSLGGVSLFSFKNFEPDDYQQQFPISNWHSFVPVWQAWPVAIWIQIDRLATGHAIVEAGALAELWHREKAYGHTIMPRIEAAHIGDIPASAFMSVLAVTKQGLDGWDVERFLP